MRKRRQTVSETAAPTDRRCTRRCFIHLAAAASLGGCLRADVSASGGETYSVALLGDTHFDSTDAKRYHSEYLFSTSEERYKMHLAEHVRNADMWKERLPSLLKASGVCAKADTAFILHMGDLVQGDCNNTATHVRMLDDAMRTIKEAYGGRLPFVMTVGNHDIRGDIPTDGTREAMDGWFVRTMSRELGRKVESTSFSFSHGPDAFIVADFNAPRPKFETLKKLLDDCSGARHVFLVTHGQAIPSGAGRWFLFGERTRNRERRELLHVLARHNAIVLAGHTHCLEYYDLELPEGRVTQFVANSVWMKPEQAVPTVLDEGAAAYGNRTKVKKLRPGRKGGHHDLVAEYRPFVRDYLFAQAAGHYRLEIGPSRVAVVFYGGATTEPTRTFLLRG